MAWRRRDDFENPAWPGMVDIFAFTLALFMIFWFSGNFPARLENLEKKNQDLAAALRTLEARNLNLSQGNLSLQQKLETLTQSHQALQAQAADLEASRRSLEDEKKAWAAQATDLNARILRLGEENLQLRDIGRQDWEELLQLLRHRLAGLPVTIIPNQRDKEIEIQGNPRITFETMQFDLAEFDEHRLEQLAPILRELRQSKQFFITISGTADPREFQRDLPPRNNGELSALRAATVAAVLENAAPGLGRHLRILGLGAKGTQTPRPAGNDPEVAYRQFRTVSLVLKIDVASLLQEGRPH